MENNNNGRGIFYGVIGVATLVVAIIGATFAYFSASITKNNIVNIGATQLTLNIIDEKSNFRTDLIPVETEGAKGTAFARYPSLTENMASTERKGCIDDVGNSICSVYQFTVENPSETTAQVVAGSLKVAKNDFTNLTYAVYKGADVNIDSYNVNDSASTTVTGGNSTGQTDAAVGTMVVQRTVFGAAGDEDDWTTNTLERLDPGEKTTYTIVIWLEETGSNQQAEQGATFAAGITFTSDTGAGVTGVITTG